jgi:hypothetical protein
MQLAVNRANHTVTGELIQEMAARFWRQVEQYRDLSLPTFNAGWLDNFKAR